MADDPDLSATPAPLRSVVGITSFRDEDRLRAAIQAEFGAALPAALRVVEAGAVSLACLAPRRYLAWGDRGDVLPARLATLLEGIAAVTDQSDLRETVRLDGQAAPQLLARLLPLDLDPDVFQIGALAATRMGHVDALVRRVAAQAYELSVTRSHAEGLHHALQALGVKVQDETPS